MSTPCCSGICRKAVNVDFEKYITKTNQASQKKIFKIQLSHKWHEIEFKALKLDFDILFFYFRK